MGKPASDVSSFLSWWFQLSALLLKNLFIFYKGKVMLVGLLCFPIIGIILMPGTQSLMTAQFDPQKNMRYTELRDVPDCVVFDRYSEPVYMRCAHFAYYVSDEINRTNSEVTARQGESGDVRDIRLGSRKRKLYNNPTDYGTSSDYDYANSYYGDEAPMRLNQTNIEEVVSLLRSRGVVMEKFDSQDKFHKGLLATPEKYDAAIDFYSKDWTYELILDYGRADDYKKQGDPYHYNKLHFLLESAITELFAPNQVVHIDLNPGGVPDSRPLEVDYGFAFKLATCFLSLVSVSMLTLPTFAVATFIAAEKRQGLVGLLRMIGLRESTYWLSWMLSFATIFLVTALMHTFVGRFVFGSTLLVFQHGSFLAPTLVAWSYMVCVASMMMALASFFQKMHIIHAIQFIFFVTIVGLQVIGAYFSETLEKTLLACDSNLWVLMIFLPNLSYSYAFEKMMRKTGIYFSRGNVDWRVFFTTNVTTGEQSMQTGNPGDGSYSMDDYFRRDSYSFECYDSGYRSTEMQLLPSIAEMMLYLWLMVFFWMILAWYFAQVFGDGMTQRCFFPFLPSYWFPRPTTAYTAGDSLGGLQTRSSDRSSIILHKLSKHYKSSTGVSELSLEIEPNSLFCLLGQNGSGKTTTIGMLSGLLHPSNGEAFVHGYNIRSDMQQIQEMMGICPQDDILFDNLTGKQNLIFWSCFRGVPDLKEHVQALLSSVDLVSAANKMVSSYSGGMKRRLSVACSTVGTPKILFLDEPTTGMDPYTRKIVWNTLKALKRDTIVLLTTHSMEEAETLGDRIAILANGRLRALGPSMQLKEQYGTGFHINLHVIESLREKVVCDMEKMLPSANVLTNSGSVVTLAVPKSFNTRLPDFFRKLEADNMDEMGIRDWSVSYTTLEEVFLRLAAQNIMVNADIDAVKQELCVLCHVRPVDNVTLYTEVNVPVSTDRLCCAPCARGTDDALPLEDAADNVPSDHAASEGVRCDLVEQDAVKAMSLGVVRGPAQMRALLYKCATIQRKQWKMNICRFCCLLIVVMCVLIMKFAMFTDYQRTPSSEWYPLACPSYGECPRYMYEYSNPLCPTRNARNLFPCRPGHVLFEEGSQHDKDWSQNVLGVTNSTQNDTDITLNVTEYSNSTLKVVLHIPSIYSAQIFAFVHRVYDNIRPAKYESRIYFQYQDSHVSGVQDIFSVLILFCPLVSMMFLPVMVSHIASEHVEKLVVMMRVHWMKMRYYWTSIILWYMGLYAIVMLAYSVLIMLTFGPSLRYDLYLILLFLWGYAQCGFAVLLSALFLRSNLLTLLTYFYIIMSSLGGFIFNHVLGNAKWPHYSLFVPSLSFIRGYALLWRVPDITSYQDPFDEFKLCLYLLASVGTVMFLVGLTILFTVGDEMSPLSQLWERFLANRIRRKVRNRGALAVEDEDADVHIERQRIANNTTDLVCLQDVEKQYIGREGTHAVKNLSLGIPRGECFGLLGVNGAGKTSTISMMSGTSLVTNGILRICGYDVSTNRAKAICNLGVCPQFDFVFAEMTVEEHLLLYARLKGVPRKTESILVRHVAELMGLDGDAFMKPAGNLSGGMRRRMMIAFSMLTLPDVVLLDEPTTGTDPETRRDVWKALQALKPGRAIVLTTHCMQEADELTDRIGIMAAGSLHCLGTSSHLKKKFGSGYKLVVFLGAENATTVIEFVRDDIGGVFAKQEENALSFVFPSGRAVLSTLFEKMQENKRSLHITQWSCSETSLDEVFDSISEQAIAKAKSQEAAEDKIPDADDDLDV